jgi:beta-1,4-mannosyl-glycoprotein beta-1,4-N-acetylglucosaminyltransferase
MKIIDCFTFFNELDLLEFRLKLLDPYIDHFVIAESNLTHSGRNKPYYFEENKKRFEPWLHKIKYIPLKQSAEGLSFNKNEISYNPESASWKLENEQRNALSAAGELTGDDDLVIVSDLDEIPDPVLLQKMKTPDEPIALSMLFHYYFFNCQNSGTERWWNGSIIVCGRQFNEITPQTLRDNRNNYKRINKGGWHFSYLGGIEKIKQKIRSFAHTEFNKDEFLQDEYLLKAINNGEDIFKRQGVAFTFVSPYYYPGRLRKLMQEYPSFLHVTSGKNFFHKLVYAVKRVFAS